ncbi:MAG: hypothetical protein QOE90_3632 [Thermoplasmata archaeon]|jgi:HEPN domain-containing protein|nr:hypothetical protein [Thermoplasmata archaeon]
MSDARALLDGSREWEDASVTEMQRGRRRVAFEAARHAAELAGKALLAHATGEHPKSHLIAGAIAKAGLLPPAVDGRALHKLLAEFTLGTYGFDRPLSDRDVRDAQELAHLLRTHAETVVGKA